MPASTLAPLNELAFGDHVARRFDCLTAAQDGAARLFQGLRQYDFFKSEDFQFKASVACVNGLRMAAASTSASRMRFANRSESKFLFPFAGGCSFQGGARGTEGIETHGSAIFLPSDSGNDVQGGARSVVTTRIDDTRLSLTARTMLGIDSQEAFCSTFSIMTPVALSGFGVSFDRAFRHIFSMVDSYQGNQTLLNASGLDDTFYRTLVMALLPDRFARQAQLRETPKDRRRLARACEYVAANLGGPISLTDLERVGHMSRKTLYNAFIKATAMSPAAWVREQRLQKARGLLTTTALSVTEVLLACGFTHPSQFAAIYARRFGELPSATSKRKQD
jgi:AraC-like DNA-binding protein